MSSIDPERAKLTEFHKHCEVWLDEVDRRIVEANNPEYLQELLTLRTALFLDSHLVALELSGQRIARTPTISQLSRSLLSITQPGLAVFHAELATMYPDINIPAEDRAEKIFAGSPPLPEGTSGWLTVYPRVPIFLLTHHRHPDMAAVLAAYGGKTVAGRLGLGTESRQWDYQSLERSVRRLSGLDTAAIPEILRDFNGHLPIVAGPVFARFDKGEVAPRVISDFTTHCIPYGQFECTREFLRFTQSQIREGTFLSYSVRVRGPVSEKLIEWASGSGIADVGPIPDIEIVRLIPLPSGREYPVVLHRSRSVASDRGVLQDEYDSADQKTIAGIRNYLHGIGRSHDGSLIYADQRDLHDGADLDPVAQVDAFLDERRGIYRRLQEALPIFASENPNARPLLLIAQNPSEKSLSPKERIALALAAIQEGRTELPLPLAPLTEVEFQTLWPKIERELLTLMTEEESRVTEERSSGKAAARIEEGFHGPAEGFQLSLLIAARDKVESYRRIDAYRARQAKERGCRPEEITDLPRYLSLDYVLAPPTLTASQVVKRMSQLPGRRVVEAAVFDPLERFEKIVRGEDRVRDLERRMYRENFERFFGNLKGNILRGYQVQPTWSLMDDANRKAQLAHALQLLEHVKRVHDLGSADVASARDLRKGILSERMAEGKRLGLRDKDLNAFMSAKRAECALHVANSEYALLVLQRRVTEDLMSAFPQLTQKIFVRLEEIRDYDICKLIYNIDANQDVVFEFEEIVDNAVHRMTHAQAARGRGSYGPGEIVFARHHESHTRFDTWRVENFRRLKCPLDVFSGYELNNSSGHYLGTPAFLPYAARVVFPLFEALGVDMSRCVLVDRLSPGYIVDMHSGRVQR